MLFDERITDVLDRKHAFVAKADEERFSYELSSFLQWLFTEDLIRPYLIEVLLADDPDKVAFAAQHRARFAELIAIRDERLSMHPSALAEEAAISEPSADYEMSLRHFDAICRRQGSADVDEDDLQRLPSSDPTAVDELSR